MSVTTQPAPSVHSMPAAVPNDYIWRLNIHQYHAMIRMGILTDDDPVELLEGWLISKMPSDRKKKNAHLPIRMWG